MLKVIYRKKAKTGERVEAGVLSLLAYFSVFEFPLSCEEIRLLLPPAIHGELDQALRDMEEKSVICRQGNFYTLQNRPDWRFRKQEGYVQAKRLLPAGLRIGRWLGKFPFVRGIGISGSLSKMCAQPDADIDFFVITRADRLWIARSIMHIYKKLTFIFGKQHFHCMNYYLDERALLLQEQNIYTAVETMTLIPVCGQGLQDFFAANDWVGQWFANYAIKGQDIPATDSGPWVSRLVEKLMGGKFGDWLDNRLMKTTTSRWEKKERRKKLNHKGSVMSLRTGKHFAWSNPGSFQQKTLECYHRCLAEVKQQWPHYFFPVNSSFEE